MTERLRSRLERLPKLLRRLPLVAVIGVAAWLVAGAHGEHVLLRYRLGDASPVSGLQSDILAGGKLVRSEEWRYPSGHPAEQLDDVELPPGDYLVEAHALGRPGPDPRPIALHVQPDGSHEAVLEFP